MWLVFVLVISGIVLYFSNVQIVFNRLLIKKNKIEFNSKIVFRIFGKLPVFSIKLNVDGIKIFKKIIPYKRFLENKEFKKLENKLKIMEKENFLELFKILKVDKIDFCLNIGMLNSFITNMLVVVTSSIMPILFNFAKENIDFEKVNYKIFPNFNEDKFEYIGEIKFQINTKDTLKYIFVNTKIFKILKSILVKLKKLNSLNNKEKTKEKAI